MKIGLVPYEFKNNNISFNVSQIERASTQMEMLKKLSIDNHIDLCVGYIEKEEDKLYSSYVLIENGKIVYNYRRVSKNWKEYEITDWHYCEGSTVEVFNYKGKVLNVGLCGDVWIYPEIFKTSNIFIWPVFVGFTLKCVQRCLTIGYGSR